MPIEALAASQLANIAPAATGLITEAGNALLQMQQNRKNREFALQQYEREKFDNLAQWHRQNEYNSPQAQMERLQLAGLNPNLVYGKGADNIAAPIVAARGQVPQGQVPRLDLSRPFSDYQNYALRKAQTDNQTVQNTVLAQEAALKAATTASVVQNTAKSKFDLDLATELRQISANVAGEQLRKLQFDNNYTIEKTEQLVAQKASNIQQAVENVLKTRLENARTEEQIKLIKEQIAQVNSSTALQNLDYQLKKNGINPNDNIFLRVAGRILGQAGSVTDVYKAFRKFIK